MLPSTDTLPTTGNGSVERPTLVLGHSFGSSRREWIEVGAMLSDEYRTVAIDTPGFGEARDVPGYSVAEMVEQYAQTLRALGLIRYVLVGHSMTGKVASILASRAGSFGLPDPEKLVLLTPTPLGEEPLAESTRSELLALHRNRASAERFVASHSRLPMPAAVRNRAVEDVLLVNQAAWNAWLADGTKEDWIDRVAPIKTETLVIAAEHDPEWGAEAQQKLTMPYLDHGSLTTVAGSGHLVPMEAPQELARLLRDFVGT